MPATSENQRKLFCAALAIKQGKAEPTGGAAKLARENSEETLRDYCESPVKGRRT